MPSLLQLLSTKKPLADRPGVVFWYNGAKMIVDETRGSKGSEQRYEVFKAFCRENHFFDKQVIQRAIVYKGKEYSELVMPTEQESIDDACQYNIQSEQVEWRDIVMDDRIVGLNIKNNYTGQEWHYILPEYRNRGSRP